MVALLARFEMIRMPKIGSEVTCLNFKEKLVESFFSWRVERAVKEIGVVLDKLLQMTLYSMA